MKRDMIKTAEIAHHNIPDYYDMDSSELYELMKKARKADANETFDALVIAFKYGFVLGHRATVAGKVKKRL